MVVTDDEAVSEKTIHSEEGIPLVPDLASPCTPASHTLDSQLKAYQEKQKDRYQKERTKHSDNYPSSNDRKVLIIGDSMVKNIGSNKINKACGRHVICKPLSGANVSDVQAEARSLMSEPDDKDKKNVLIVHVGTNDLAKNSVNKVKKNLEDLATEFQPTVEALAISSVTTRLDDPVLTGKVDELNRSISEICKKNKIGFIDNSNIGTQHLNGSNLHLNRDGDRKLGSNLCWYLRSICPNQGKKTHFQGSYKNHDPRNWKAYLDYVARITRRT